MNTGKLIGTLKQDEGWEPFVYEDHLGFKTIGYGFLVDPKKGGGLPREVGDYWLEFAINERWERLKAARPWIEGQPEEVQQALANMAYQMGVQGVLRFKKMLEALEAGDREKAAEEALDSRWAKQTPERAERVAELIRDHQKPA